MFDINFTNVALILIFALNLLLGLIIYIRGKKSRINQIFSLIVSCAGLWAFFIFIYLNQSEPFNIVFWANINFMVISTIPFLLVLFSYFFPVPNSWPFKKNIFLFLLPLVVIWVLAIGSKITISARSVTDYEYGYGYIAFYIYFILYLAFAYLKLFYSFKTVTGIAKIQVKYVLLGTSIFSAIAAIFSLFLPSIGVKNLIVYGPLYSIILIGFTTYAITRYRLMDIRLIIIRSLVFGLIVFITSGIFSVISALVTYTFANLAGVRSSIVSSLIVVTLISIFYLPLRKFIEKITNNFLYKKTYNPDVLLSEINEVTASILDLKHLLASISGTLSEAFSSQKIGIGLLDKNKKLQIAYKDGFKEGVAEGLANYPDVVKKLYKELKAIKGILVIDEMRTQYENEEFQPVDPKLLETIWQNDVALIIPLYAKEQLIGIIALGNKKSGDPYNNQDLATLKIIAGQAGIAIENARLYDEMKDFGAKLEVQVKEKTKELRKANVELRHLDQAKSEFISIASHQLRTPLTIIKGYISMMEEGSFGEIPKPIRENLRKIYISNERLIHLVENLLDISRIESGRQEFTWKKIQLEDLAKGVIENLKPTAKDKGLKLILEKPSKKLPKILADEDKLHEVVINFIDNAIKYTTKGEIEISITPGEQELTFCVKDNGRGIDPKIKPNLFKKFSRGKGSFRVHTEGVGLGLYVAKMIIDAHSGKIWAESKGRDKGSKFCFSIPLKHTPKEVKPRLEAEK